MSFLRSLAALTVAAAALIPTIARGQNASLGGEVFWAHTTSLPGSPGLGGFAATLQSGGVGVRGSAGFNRRYDAYGVTDVPWMVDADFFINSGALGQVVGVALGSFAPVGFLGIGQQGIRDAAGAVSTVSTMSYGGGGSVPLFAGLRLAAEVRQRRALSGVPELVPSGMGTGRELRLSLTFGGRRSAARRTGGPVARRDDGVVLAGGARERTNASASARRVLATGEEYLGVKYVYGGEDPRTGIDCSAFTQLVFRRNGVSLPRTSRQQVTVGREVLMDFSVVRPGDLLFFASSGSRIDHVAIYAGDNRILHATSSGGAVRYDDLGSQRGEWFVNHLVAVRRVLDDDGRSLVRSFDAARWLAPVPDGGDSAPWSPRLW